MELVKVVKPEIKWPGIPDQWASVPALEHEFERAGFKDVRAEEVEVELEFESYEAICEVMLCRMPAMVQLTKDFSGQEKEKLKEVVMQDLKRVAPEEPGRLKGTALVAVGRK